MQDIGEFEVIFVDYCSVPKCREEIEPVTAMLAADNWEARLPALTEARKLVLERYQFFPQMQNVIERYYKNLPKRSLLLQPYRERQNYIQKTRRYLSRLVRKL